jgi:SAM-dependent methyltransferase
LENNPTCPVCDTRSWKVIGSRTYRRDQDVSTSAYVRQRLAVLFEVWFPEMRDVTLSSVLCQQCGFVCYTPRPEDGDIARKYSYLAENRSTQHEISEDLASDEQRSVDLYARIEPYLPTKKASILDFGGGKGRLMHAFLTHGHRCYLIDYPSETLRGIQYLGSRLDEIPPGLKFDLIICSHVLEHLADPLTVVRALRDYLEPNGVAYIEVPLEIWRKAPLPVEPVTHVNYFSVDSVSTLFERAGYEVMTCKDGIYTTEMGTPGLAIRAVGKGLTGQMPDIRLGHGAAATLQMLEPSYFYQLIHALKYPALTRREIRRFVHRSLSKTPVLWRVLAGRRND